MTIRRRITVAAAAAVAVTMLLVIAASYVVVRSQLLIPIDESLVSRAAALARLPGVGQGGGEGFGRPGEGFLRPGAGDFDATYYQVVRVDTGASLDLPLDELTLPAPEEEPTREPSLRSVWVDDVHLRVVTVSLDDTVYLQIARPLTEADEALASIALRLAFLGLLGIAGAAALGLLVSRTAVRPIERLRNDVGVIAETEELGERVAVDGDDEVAQLAGEFNELLAKLEGSRAQQVRLVRDAGHELRTPLTALRMNLELLQRHEVPADQRAEMLEAAHAEVEELSSLVTEIVDLATDSHVEEPMVLVPLTEVVDSVVERVSRRNGRVIAIESDGSIVTGRREALERAVSNIVNNADSWTPAEDAIDIAVHDHGITVRDRGPGFAERDLPHVFDRFYRADHARTTPGSGLGLSIVEKIVADHGGAVFARNRDDGPGAEVGFRLPS